MESTLLHNRKSIFDDRRNRLERRQQSVPMQVGMDRRTHDRRLQRFSARDWWLETDYAVELFRENKRGEIPVMSPPENLKRRPPGKPKEPTS